jgi:hypothetical protein
VDQPKTALADQYMRAPATVVEYETPADQAGG